MQSELPRGAVRSLDGARAGDLEAEVQGCDDDGVRASGCGGCVRGEISIATVDRNDNVCSDRKPGGGKGRNPVRQRSQSDNVSIIEELDGSSRDASGA